MAKQWQAWTTKEIDFILEHYSTNSADKIATHLPGRTRNGVYAKIRDMQKDSQLRDKLKKQKKQKGTIEIKAIKKDKPEKTQPLTLKHCSVKGCFAYDESVRNHCRALRIIHDVECKFYKARKQEV